MRWLQRSMREVRVTAAPTQTPSLFVCTQAASVRSGVMRRETLPNVTLREGRAEPKVHL